MNAASTLINGLAGERVRWTAQSKEFKFQIGQSLGQLEDAGDVGVWLFYIMYCSGTI